MPVKQIGCMMCGKYTPLHSFLNDSLDPENIHIIEQVGGGRGKGFITISEESGFDNDDVVEAVTQRIKSVVNLFRDHGRTILPDAVLEQVRSMVGKIEETLSEDHRDWMTEDRNYPWLEILALGQERLIDEFESAASLTEEG